MRENSNDLAFRYHGIKIDDRSQVKRYCDVLDTITQASEMLNHSPLLVDHFNKFPKNAVFSVEVINRNPELYLGCVCFNDQNNCPAISFGAFDKDKNRIDIPLGALKHISPSQWRHLIEITENQAGQMTKYLNNPSKDKADGPICPDHSYGISWAKMIVNDDLPNFQNVVSLGLTEMRGNAEGSIPVTTPKQLHEYVEKSRKAAEKRREDPSR